MSENSEENVGPNLFLGFFMLIGIVCFLGGIGVFFDQVYGFLKTGVWGSVSMIDALNVLGNTELSEWARIPESWKGVHKMLEFMPAAIGLPIFGGLILGAAASREE